MDTITQALRAVWDLMLGLLGAVIGVIALVENWLHAQLSAFGVHQPTQSIIMILVALALVLVAFRALGGLIRVLLVLLLILFAIHVALPLVRQ